MSSDLRTTFYTEPLLYSTCTILVLRLSGLTRVHNYAIHAFTALVLVLRLPQQIADTYGFREVS